MSTRPRERGEPGPVIASPSMSAAPPSPPGSPQDPRDPKLWAAAYLEFLPKIAELVRPPASPRDVLQDALEKASGPGPARWDPARGTLNAYLQAVIKGLASNERRAAVHRREARKDDAVLARRRDPAEGADDVLALQEREEEEREQVDAVRAELVAAGDDEAARVLAAIEDDVEKPAELAAATGLTVDQVANARRRIARIHRRLAS
jgi:hypothetical protein